MFFDDPQNALSVARTHQQELVEQEQRDSLARQAQDAQRNPRRPGLGSWWYILRAVGWWLRARVAWRGTPRGKKEHLAE
jgi:hypothetical protein